VSRAVHVVVAVVALLAAGCGGGRPAPPPTPPVPAAVVPGRVDTGGLTIQPNTAPETSDAFASVGRPSLVTEGRVWEVRQGDRLVGALELATLGRRADTRRGDDRLAIRQQILPGEPAELDFFGTPVYQAKDGERNVYLWFGRQVFGVLQLKGTVDVDAVANELITVILQDERWPGLPPETFEE
jgi:hypothetical protein